MHRVFVAINFPEEIKKRIKAETEALKLKFDPAAIRFLTPENWHLTLSFLGYQEEKSVDLIIRAMEEICKNQNSFMVKLEKIIYGPPKTPRMIWMAAAAETSQKMALLKTALEDKLAEAGVKFKRERRLFSAHVTLARFRQPMTVLPEIKKNIMLEFEADSLDLMESHLRRSGAEYSLWLKQPLSKKF
jgi:2'-5' RNA ligase